MKKTKRSLFTSLVTLLLCSAMFVGSTFAWFTDTVSNTGNRIQAGTLDVDLLMDKKQDGNYVSIAEGEGDIFATNSEKATEYKDDRLNGILWEPGKTEIAYLAVQNKGKLALKYYIVLNIKGELAGALEYAILDGAKASHLVNATKWSDITSVEGVQVGDVTTGVIEAAKTGTLDKIADDSAAINETDYFALAVHMKDGAGNEYQDKNIVIDVHLVAGQATAEMDGFGTNTYDAESTYGQIPDSPSGGPIIFDPDNSTIVTGLSEDFEGDTIILTEGIEEIAPNAFKGHSEINFVSLPSSLTKIGEGAFSGMGDFTAEINGDQLEMKNVIDLDWTDKSKVDLIFRGKVCTYSQAVKNEDPSSPTYGNFYPVHPYSSAGSGGRELTLTFADDVTFISQDFVMANINKISFVGENQVIKFSDLNFNVQGNEIHNNAPVFNMCSGNKIIEFHSLPAPGSEIRATMTGGDSGFKFRAACSQTDWENAGFPTIIGGVNVEFNYDFTK